MFHSKWEEETAFKDFLAPKPIYFDHTGLNNNAFLPSIKKSMAEMHWRLGVKF